MQTFAEFLENAANGRQCTNLLFESCVVELIRTLTRISQPLEQGLVPHEVVGGLAVFLHVENANPSEPVSTARSS